MRHPSTTDEGERQGGSAPLAFDEFGTHAGDGRHADDIGMGAAGAGCDETPAGNGHAVGDASEDFAEEPVDTAWAVFEDHLAAALAIDDGAEFLGALIGGVFRVARALQPPLAAESAAPDPAMHRPVRSLLSTAALLASTLELRADDPDEPAADTSQARPRRANAMTAPRVPMTAPGRLFATLGRMMAARNGDEDAFDALASLYVDEAVDEALPLLVGVATRLAVRALPEQHRSHDFARLQRPLVRAVADAARTLLHRRAPDLRTAVAIRALPAIVQASVRHARRQDTPVRDFVSVVAQGIGQAAVRARQRPHLLRRLTRTARAITPLSRPARVGRDLPSIAGGDARHYRFNGPVELTIRAL